MGNALSRWQVNFASNERMDISDFQTVLQQILADHINFNQLYFDDIPFSLTGNTVSTSYTISAIASTSGINTGMVVSGAGIPIGATVVSVGTSTVTIDAPASATANTVSLSFTASGKTSCRYTPLPMASQNVPNSFILEIDRPRSVSDQQQDWLNQQASALGTTYAATGIFSDSISYVEVQLGSSTDKPQTRAFWNPTGGPLNTGAQYVDTLNIRSRIDETIAVHLTPSGYPWVPLFAVAADVSGNVTGWWRADDLLWKPRVFTLPASRNLVYESSIQNMRTFVDALGALVGEIKGLVVITQNCTIKNGSPIVLGSGGAISPPTFGSNVGLTNAAEIAPGMSVSGTGIQGGTIVEKVANASDGSVVITLSLRATVTSASEALTFTGNSSSAATPWSTLKLLREFQNYFCTSIVLPVFNSGTGVITLGSDIDIYIAGRAAVYSVAMATYPTITLADGECAYVSIPDAISNTALTVNVASLESLIIDKNISGSLPNNTFVLFFNKSGNLYGPATEVPINTASIVVISEATLASAIAFCSANGGGVINIAGSFSIASAHTIPVGTRVIGQCGATVIAVTSSGSIALSTGSIMDSVWFSTALTSGSEVLLPNNYAVVRNCQFVIPPASTGQCIYVTGNANKMYNNVFTGVVSETATAINYAAGVDNADEDSVFLP